MDGQQFKSKKQAARSNKKSMGEFPLVYEHVRSSGHRNKYRQNHTDHMGLIKPSTRSNRLRSRRDISLNTKATRAFIDSLHQRMSELDLYTQKKTGELAEKRLQIKDSIKKLDQLRVDGILSDSEHKDFLAVKEAALEETKIEIDAHNEADHQTFKEGLRVIELFINVWNFMQKPGKELEKARLAKWVLSNPTLTDRTLQFHYEKPFDVLLQLAGQHIWWKHRQTNLFNYLTHLGHGQTMPQVGFNNDQCCIS